MHFGIQSKIYMSTTNLYKESDFALDLNLLTILYYVNIVVLHIL